MIFPRKDAIYQNLNTSFTNFGELLVDLKENFFTGVVQVSFWEYEGILLLDSGNIINAIQEIDGNILTGQEAVRMVTEKAKEKDGAVSVFSQSGDMVTMLASIAKSEVVYKDLSTEFTSLDALITKLRNEDHTGYIEINLMGGQQTGYIFLLSGEIINTLLTARGDEISGPVVLNRILEITAGTSANFSVYRAAVEEALSESETIRVSYNLPQLLEVWGAVIGALETVVDNQFGQDTFLNTFKDTLIANADEYPYLDPFAALFQYQDGTVSFSGTVTKNFSNAIGKCLWDTVEILAERAALESFDLFGSIRASLEPVNDQYRDQISRFNIPEILPDLF
jgi:hypothetical protein